MLRFHCRHWYLYSITYAGISRENSCIPKRDRIARSQRSCLIYLQLTNRGNSIYLLYPDLTKALGIDSQMRIRSKLKEHRIQGILDWVVPISIIWVGIWSLERGLINLLTSRIDLFLKRRRMGENSRRIYSFWKIYKGSKKEMLTHYRSWGTKIPFPHPGN